MRIVIDMQGAQTESRFRGIGRYSFSLAQAIARNPGNHDIWIALNCRLPESIPAIKTSFAGLIPENQIRIFDVPCENTPDRWISKASELIREAFYDSLQPDFVLVTSLFEGYCSNAVTSIGTIKTRHQTVVILYDLIPFLNKDLYLPSPELQEYYNKKIDWLINADLVLAISDSSRRECIKHIDIKPEKITNISAAIDPKFKVPEINSTDVNKLFTKYGIKYKPILYVPGGFDSRKNFAQLIEAYSLLKQDLRQRFQLVIASKMPLPQQIELIELAKKFNIKKDELILTGYLEDQDLILLYAQAELFVFPSKHEGFGLPALEAMSCGAPVIGSDNSSIPEVIGLSEALFNPNSSQSIADKITKALTDDGFRTRLLENGKHQSQKFSWDTSAKLAIAAMELSNSANNRAVVPEITINSLIQEITNTLDEEPSEAELCNVASSISFNTGINVHKKLLLDISTIVHTDAKSGIQRVVRSLMQELLSSPRDDIAIHPIYFDNGIYRYANHYTETVTGNRADHQDSPIDFHQGDIYLSLDLNMHLTTQMQPVHEQMHLMGVKFNFIVYDLLLIHRPDWWPAPNPDFYRNWLQNISLVGDKLICISRAVASELDFWLEQHSSERIDNGPAVCSFHLGADIDNSMPTRGLPDDATQILNTLSNHNSFLMVGTLEPRKGHAQTISAFEQLWKDGVNVNLVIVGKQGWMLDELVTKIRQHHELGKHLFWLEGISDEYLEKIYTASTCLIASSEGEGFGLPLIEAAQHALPIIARDIPVFREVANEHAFYFSGLHPETLSASITHWLTLNFNGKAPQSNDIPWLTWRESTDQLISVVLEDVTINTNHAMEIS